MRKLSLINTRKDLREDVIERPSHYVEGRTIEPIGVIEDWNLNHHLACALKYISRAGRKNDEIKDLQKGIWYLERRIGFLKKDQEIDQHINNQIGRID